MPAWKRIGNSEVISLPSECLKFLGIDENGRNGVMEVEVECIVPLLNFPRKGENWRMK